MIAPAQPGTAVTYSGYDASTPAATLAARSTAATTYVGYDRAELLVEVEHLDLPVALALLASFGCLF